MFKMMNNIRKKRSNKKGFTLVELIVVIVIILILAAVLVPSVLKYVEKANEANCKADAATILTQMQADYAASQAPDQMGSVTFPAAINGITPVTASGTSVVAGDLSGTSAKIVYQITTATVTGGVSTGEITSFGYNNGRYVAIYAGGKWSMSKATAGA